MAEDLRALQQLATVDHQVELDRVDEMVVETIDLARARRPCRHRDRHGEVIVDFEQAARNSGLAGPGRRGKNQHQAAALNIGDQHGESQT
jgi:hypothetical protein